MRITTWNVNSLRSALRKRFTDHLAELSPDVLLLQEIRARPDQLPPGWADPPGWSCLWHPAEKAGYAGVATWSREPMELLSHGVDGPDPEGRVLRSRVGELELINVYLPSGTRGGPVQDAKEAWMDRFLPWASALAAASHPVILCGDLNIAHTPNDIHNASGNKRTSGFLPQEREWFTSFLASGWTDLLRTYVGEVKGPWSWWSNRGRARELDRGWRIDYILANAVAAPRLQRAWIHREGGMDTSDHAPLTVELA